MFKRISCINSNHRPIPSRSNSFRHSPWCLIYPSHVSRQANQKHHIHTANCLAPIFLAVSSLSTHFWNLTSQCVFVSSTWSVSNALSQNRSENINEVCKQIPSVPHAPCMGRALIFYVSVWKTGLPPILTDSALISLKFIVLPCQS